MIKRPFWPHTLSLTRMDKQKCWCNPLKKPRIVIKHSHSDEKAIVVQLRIKTVINYLIKLSHGGRSRCVMLSQQNRVDWLWNSKTEFTYIHRCVCGVCIRMSFAFCHSFYGDCWCWWFRFHWSQLVSEQASEASKCVYRRRCVCKTEFAKYWMFPWTNLPTRFCSLFLCLTSVAFALVALFCHCMPVWVCVCAILYLGRVTPKVNILCEVFFP